MTIASQYETAKNSNWLDFFEEAHEKYNLPVELLLAIASRESGMRNIVGDHGRGFGLMQIDSGAFPLWCKTDAWQNPRNGIFKGALVLSDNIKTVHRLQGKRCWKTWGGKVRYTAPKGLSTEQVMRVAIAGYNTGVGNSLWGQLLGTPDRTTTGGDYSRDVLQRAADFRRLIEADRKIEDETEE